MPDQPLSTRILGGRFRVGAPPAVPTGDDERDFNVDNSGNLGVNIQSSAPLTATISGTVPVTGAVTVSGGPVTTTPSSPGFPPGIAEDQIAILEVLDEPLARLLDNLNVKVIQDTPGDLHVTVDALPAVPNQNVTITGPVSVVGQFFQALQLTQDASAFDMMGRILRELQYMNLQLLSLLTSAGASEASENDLLESAR